MSPTVLITGAAGFLGKHVAAHFAANGWRVVGMDLLARENINVGAMSDYHRIALPSPNLGDLLRVEKPQAFIHCAGRASVPLSMDDPASDFRDNTVLTFEVLDALRRFAPRCRFILLSSAAVYGNPESLPISESHQPAPLSPYGFHKWQCELLCQEFSRIYDLATASVRIFSAYGPGLQRQVIWDICHKALVGAPLCLRGTGHESRDFIHATDIARALRTVVEKADCRGECYNLASGNEVTIGELARQLMKALGLGISAEFDGQASPGVPLCWRADISKIAALGFVPSIELKDGLDEVARWTVSQHIEQAQ